MDQDILVYRHWLIAPPPYHNDVRSLAAQYDAQKPRRLTVAHEWQ